MDALAFLTALVWAVHPLQIETVIYVTQRTGIDGGAVLSGNCLCELEILVGGVRSRKARDLVGACDGGLPGRYGLQGSHGTAPVVVLLMERTLISGSFREAIRKSWRLYLGLSAGWVLLAALNYGAPCGVHRRDSI